MVTSASTASQAKGASKSEAVYRALRERITSGTYSPGHRLVLGKVADEFGVSAVPVREAVRKLEAEGLVDFQRNVGATVTGIDQHAYDDAMEALAYLEGVATALAAPHLTKAELKRAHKLNQQLRESTENFDPIGFTSLNQQFHELLCSKCPNKHLLTLVNREWNQLSAIRRSTFSFVPGRAQISLAEHEHILTLISDRAPDREIELAARMHKFGTRRAFDESRQASGA
ncbi:GntR family transcriptional regulator [Streptomyces sp. NPDC057474]|uniref:GntR family transcriptional regulator n=1 Tax=Streptomyces sp. NPDC057474 TaxID=3346144 RepID=UPI0036843D33